MTSNEPTPDHILQTGLAFWASKTLLSAVEMEVFTELAKGPEDLHSLTGRLGLHPRSSRDFLDALVALGFLERNEGKYSNTPSADLFLDKHKPSYVGGILEMANKRLFHHLGAPHHRPSHRHEPERSRSGRTRYLHHSLRRPHAPQGLSSRHDRHQPRRQHGHRFQIPLGQIQVRRRLRHSPGRSHRAGRTQKSAHCWRRLRSA